MWISSQSSRATLSTTSRPIGRAVSLALVLSSLTFAAGAEEGPVVPMTVSPGLAVGPLDVSKGETFELSLEQALLYALQHNVSLVVQRYERSRSLLGIDAERGLYDFNLEADALTSSSTRPTSSVLENADVISSDTDRLNFRLQRNIPWGGGFQLSFNNSKSQSSDANVQPNPYFSLGLSLGFEQPLMRNFGKEITERSIWVASNNSKLNREAFRNQIESIVQQVSDSYWNLVGARQQLAVSEESLKLAKELHEMNRIQVEVGTKAPLELVQSEVGVATREEEIIRRRAAVEDSEDSLRGLMNLVQTELWSIPIVPVTPAEIAHQPVDLPAAVATARKKRVDIVRQQLVNEQRQLDLRIAANQKKPRLDLQTNFGYSAIAGDISFTDSSGHPVVINKGYSDALEQLTDRDFDAWSIQLNFAVPLENTTAKAKAAQAELLVEQGNLELRDLLDQAMLDVRRAARQVETAAKAIELGKISSKLARKNLEAEQKRYENGLSTSFQVLQIQEDLSIALSNEVNAIITYRKAVVALDRAKGELLEKTGVRLADDDGPEAN